VQCMAQCMGQGRSLHLPMEIREHLMDGLVPVGANFMFVKLTTIVKEINPMHLVLHSDSYKIMLKIVT
jgi:hypothetical protein